MGSPPVVQGSSATPSRGPAPIVAAVAGTSVAAGARSVPGVPGVPHVTGSSATPQRPATSAARAPVHAALARPASTPGAAAARPAPVHVTAPAELSRAAVETMSVPDAAEPASAAERPPEPHRRGAPKGAPPDSTDGRVVSKAQQRLGFAKGYPWAATAAKSGTEFKALPDHKR